MKPELARAIIALGPDLHPGLFAASEGLYASFHERAVPAGIIVTRDEKYGPDERNRLDVFSKPSPAAQPVLLFVHGGGFVTGDKSVPDSPYYDNVGFWAAKNGFVGATMTYRLAPAHRYPSGAIDVAAAVRWIRANASRHGGDPEAIVVVGQSAGAIHAATYAARTDLYVASGGGVAAFVLLSGVYDFTAANQPPHVYAYFGDAATAAAASPLAGLVCAGVPLMLAVAQFDPPAFHYEALRLADAYFERHGRLPFLSYLPGHNHITEIVHLGARGTDDDFLATNLLAFAGAALSSRADASSV
jgi:triacylglycerol lipase